MTAGLQEAVDMLREVIASAHDPVARAEAEAAALRKELLRRLRIATARVAEVERELQRLEGNAGQLEKDSA